MSVIPVSEINETVPMPWCKIRNIAVSVFRCLSVLLMIPLIVSFVKTRKPNINSIDKSGSSPTLIFYPMFDDYDDYRYSGVPKLMSVKSDGSECALRYENENFGEHFVVIYFYHSLNNCSSIQRQTQIPNRNH